ncbi:unnamed protein product [Sphagnum balticum]
MIDDDGSDGPTDETHDVENGSDESENREEEEKENDREVETSNSVDKTNSPLENEVDVTLGKQNSSKSIKYDSIYEKSKSSRLKKSAKPLELGTESGAEDVENPLLTSSGRPVSMVSTASRQRNASVWEAIRKPSNPLKRQAIEMRAMRRTSGLLWIPEHF